MALLITDNTAIINDVLFQEKHNYNCSADVSTWASSDEANHKFFVMKMKYKRNNQSDDKGTIGEFGAVEPPHPPPVDQFFFDLIVIFNGQKQIAGSSTT